VLGNGLDAFVWWANSLAFFALITYIFVNSSAIAYFLKARRTGTRWNPLLHLILPVIGILFDAYLIYQAFFVALWGSGFRTGQSVVIFGVALALVAIIWTLVVRARKGDDATTNIAEADDVIARETEERDQQDRLRAAGSAAE
jgi:amino acid transporter